MAGAYGEISISAPFQIDIWSNFIIFVGYLKMQVLYVDERGRKHYSKGGEG